MTYKIPINLNYVCFVIAALLLILSVGLAIMISPSGIIGSVLLVSVGIIGAFFILNVQYEWIGIK